MRATRFATAALILSVACTLPAIGQVKATGSLTPTEPTRLHPIPVQLDSIRQLRVTTRGRILGDDIIPTDGGLRGPCSAATSSHTDANFGGGSFVVQAGFAQQEIFASTYPFTVPAGVQLPAQIKIDLMEFILATSGSTVQTTTRYTILVWIGTPQTGTLVWSNTSSLEPGDLPDAVIPPGTNGINIQVSVDPGDPEQIILTNDGSNQFSIGFRIDVHNSQTANPCFTAPPTTANAFPCTDTSGLSQPARNWLFGVNCGAFGCPANGGWASFAALPGFCRPSGDTVMRATWEFINCQTVLGSCCTGQTCSITTQTLCTGGGGSYRGDNTNCGTPCPIPTGSCCTDGVCSIVTQANCAGTYRGDNTTCATACPTPQGACCFSSNSCLILSPADCAQIAGSSYLGTGTACGAGNTCPSGACCLSSGGCITTTPPGCALISGATFQGIGTTCATANCPLPTGACCLSSGGCISNQSQANCSLIPGGSWAGANTNCTTGCCRPDWDHNGVLQPSDVAAFINSWSTSLQQGTLAGDYDSSGQVNPADVSAFINDWFATLSGGGC